MIATRRSTLSTGDALRSLIYLDWHLFLNRLHTIRRDPKRLAMWSIFVLLILLAIPQRLMIRSSAAPSFAGLSTLLDTVATFVPGIVLLFIGLLTATSRKAMGLFRSAADARFLTGSALPQRLVVVWLDFRMLRLALAQLPMLVFWFVIFGTSLGSGVLGVFRFWISTGLFLGLIIALNLPLLKLGQRHAIVMRLGGLLLAGIGIASLGSAVSELSRTPLAIPPAVSTMLLGLPPGSWVVGGFRGDPWSLIALVICAVVALWLTIRVADDVYPEIWESSLRMITVRTLMRQRGGLLTPREARGAMREAGVPLRQDRIVTTVSSRGRHVPPGAWTLLWKEWLATIRVRGGLRLPLIALILAVIIGWAVAGGFGRLPDFVRVNLIAFPAYFLVFSNVLMSVRLGIDLRNPLWWLTSASLEARLLVLTLARSLRQVVPLAAGLLAASIAARSVVIFILGLPIVAAAVWALQAMGIGTYSIIPSPGDLRGPGQLLRMFLLFALLIPVIIVFGVGAAVSGHLAVGLLLAAAAGIFEGWGLVMFAASRLRGNGLAFAQAERR